jgi:hypothetical protein
MRNSTNWVKVCVIASFIFFVVLSSAPLQAHNLQICKVSDPTSPVSGSFNFSVTGQQAPSAVPVGGCINFPDLGSGTFAVTEQSSPGVVVTNIVIDPLAEKVSVNMNARTASVTLEEGITTTVTFTNSSQVTSGRFTGGGSIFTDTGDRVTHGFELHCSTTDTPNNLEVNFSSNRFHLETLTSVACSVNPVTKVATIAGTGTGRYNGAAGATISFTFTDAGEPGRFTDFASYLITDSGSNVVLNASGLLDSGNQQFHKQ